MHKPKDTSFYQKRRDYVYRAASEDYPLDGFVFRAITQQDATDAATRWHSQMNWPRQYSIYNTCQPDRFDLAVDHQNKLCVLCYGKPSDDSLALEIDYIERDTTINIMAKALSIVEYAARIYARFLKVSELRLTFPIDDVIKHYLESGYIIDDTDAHGKVLSMSKNIKTEGAKGDL